MSKVSLLELSHGEKKYEILNKQVKFTQHLNISVLAKVPIQRAMP